MTNLQIMTVMNGSTDKEDIKAHYANIDATGNASAAALKVTVAALVLANTTIQTLKYYIDLMRGALGYPYAGY